MFQQILIQRSDGYYYSDADRHHFKQLSKSSTATTAATGVAKANSPSLLLSTNSSSSSALSPPSMSLSVRRRRRGRRRRHLQQDDNDNNEYYVEASSCTDDYDYYDDKILFCGLPGCNETQISEEINGTAICLDSGEKHELTVVVQKSSNSSSCTEEDSVVVSDEKYESSTSYVCQCIGPSQVQGGVATLKCWPMELEIECRSSSASTSSSVATAGDDIVVSYTVEELLPNGFVTQREYTCECGGDDDSCDNVQCTNSYKETIASPNYCVNDVHCDCYTEGACDLCPF